MNKTELAAIRYRLRTWDTGATALRDFVEHAVEDLEELVELVDLIVDEDDEDVTKALAFAREYDIGEAREMLEACDGETVEDVRAALALIATDSPDEVARLVELGRKVDGYEVDAMIAAWIGELGRKVEGSLLAELAFEKEIAAELRQETERLRRENLDLRAEVRIADLMGEAK